MGSRSLAVTSSGKAIGGRRGGLMRGARRSARAGADAEHGVLRSYALQLLVGGSRADAFEEDAHLDRPALEVRAQDRHLLALVEHLGCAEALRARADQQAALPARAQVAHPLRVPARGDEILLALQAQQVDGRAPRLAARAPAHLQHARAV